MGASGEADWKSMAESREMGDVLGDEVVVAWELCRGRHDCGLVGGKGGDGWWVVVVGTGVM